MCVHDNGECRLSRAGFGGAEYYLEQPLLERISQFVKFGVPVGVTIYPVSGNEKSDFYEADASLKSHWQNQLKAIGVVKVQFGFGNILDSEGGMARIPEFYAHRDNDAVGFQALAEFDRDKRVPMELELGFDSTASNSLYQSSS